METEKRNIKTGTSCRTCNESKYGMDSGLKKGNLDPGEISAKKDFTPMEWDTKIPLGRQGRQD